MSLYTANWEHERKLDLRMSCKHDCMRPWSWSLEKKRARGCGDNLWGRRRWSWENKRVTVWAANFECVMWGSEVGALTFAFYFNFFFLKPNLIEFLDKFRFHLIWLRSDRTDKISPYRILSLIQSDVNRIFFELDRFELNWTEYFAYLYIQSQSKILGFLKRI